ncbi:hypothetical protein FBZ96_11238 [Bradyrhizobium stylosanthis]|uniref:Uncharacterized protein n=1 Tax=Bradyrhizobium stylosanthis TaxID=1803665 RepID=A0A560D4K0_9BRAD|nr:hypothetical protein FBZ96_11238 [Bradyrhizobium stylosanthis]
MTRKIGDIEVPIDDITRIPKSEFLDCIRVALGKDA